MERGRREAFQAEGAGTVYLASTGDDSLVSPNRNWWKVMGDKRQASLVMEGFVGW